VISGGTPRIDLTVQTLKCINGQTLKPNEKIFINHGHAEEIMKKLVASRELTDNWKIISFPINTYDPTDLNSLFKFTGPASLDAASSKYIFYIADDDLISADFFDRMSVLINDHPEVIVASGLAVSLDDNGSILYPPKGAWDRRDMYEQGINVFRNICKPDDLYQPNPGHSYIIKKSLLEETRSTIFTWGFPDRTPLFQIIPRGLYAFDKMAFMIRNNHTGQIHNDWDKNNTQINLYLHNLKKMMKLNLKTMRNIQGVHKSDLKLLKNHFRREATRSSWFSIRNIVPDFDSNNQTWKTPFQLKLRYFIRMLRTPVYTFRLVLRPGRLKNFRFLGKI
jgi:hypothetical protein